MVNIIGEQPIWRGFGGVQWCSSSAIAGNNAHASARPKIRKALLDTPAERNTDSPPIISTIGVSPIRQKLSPKAGSRDADCPRPTGGSNQPSKAVTDLVGP